MGETRECARYIVDLRFEMLPEKVVDQTKDHLLDALGCGIFGSTLLHCQQLRRVVERLGGNPEAPVLGTGLRTSGYLASMLNGTQINGFEMEDVGVFNHPAAALVPAAIAFAAKGRISGKELLTALVASYEVSTRIAECTSLAPESEIGWHTPGFHGCFSSVICAGKLMGLSEQEMHRALGIAGDLAGGGLMSARVGAAASKRLHCGKAAATGVLAALLAQEGFTGVPDVIELEPWGYAWALSGYRGRGPKPWNLAEITRGLGEEYTFGDKIMFKYYPAIGLSPAVIENVQQLKKQHRFILEDIQHVAIKLATFHYESRVRREVDDLTSANFSPEYAAALALTYDLPPLDQSPVSLALWVNKIHDPAIHALLSKIEEYPDEEMDRINAYSADSTVEIRLKDGRILSQSSEYEKNVASLGTKRLRQMTRAELRNKFRNVATIVIAKDAAEAVIDAIDHLEECQDVATIFEKCTGA